MNTADARDRDTCFEIQVRLCPDCAKAIHSAIGGAEIPCQRCGEDEFLVEMRHCVACGFLLCVNCQQYASDEIICEKCVDQMKAEAMK